MPPTTNSDATLRTERVISATPQRVFTAFEQPDQLMQWWGPDGFTNTFEQFEFQVGGLWVFVMHGPNGIDYPNECRFRQLEPTRLIVIEHVVAPWFLLTVSLTALGDQTQLTWVQEFEDPQVANQLRAICEPCNEQNLDRLQVLLRHDN